MKTKRTVKTTKRLNRPLTREDFGMTFEEKLRNTDFFVEASSFEKMELWSRFFHDSKDNDKLVWVQDSMGYSKIVGHLAKHPVNVSFSWALIGKKYVCFYEPVSKVVDWDMVEKWITKNFPIKHDGRSAMTDAGNFHICYNYCRK